MAGHYQHTPKQDSPMKSTTMRRRWMSLYATQFGFFIAIAMFAWYQLNNRPSNVCLSSQPAVNVSIGSNVPMSAVNQDVDIVITWVNGSDPQWQKGFQAQMGHLHFARSRFIASNEIFFCLASIQVYAPWVRKIFVVTQNQRFDTSLFTEELRQKIVFVDHRQFMPSTALPTFSSLALETSLHRIPGLTEHFIYMNDDFFFWNTLPKEGGVFDDGRFKFVGSLILEGGFFDKRIGNFDKLQGPNTWTVVYANDAKLIRERYGLQIEFFWHAGYFLTKTGFEEAWRQFSVPLNVTLHNKLRIYRPLDKGGDVNSVYLAATLGLMRGYQTFDGSIKAIPMSANDVEWLKTLNDRQTLWVYFQSGLGDTPEEKLALCSVLMARLKGGFVPEEQEGRFCQRW